MSAHDELLLGLDIGTASSKAVLTSPDGCIVASAQVSHSVARPREGYAEHDAEAVWWTDVRVLCERLSRAQALRNVTAVCVSGIGPCVVPCDGHGSPLRPAILYGVDTRAGAEIEELTRRYGAASLFRRCGSALTSQALGPKILWIKRHEPDLWQRTAGWFTASSFIVHKLTGEYALDHHTASQCDPMYDLHTASWADDWAQEITSPVRLPALAWPADVVGGISTEGAAATGLPCGCPVVCGTIDAWAEAFSVGVRKPLDTMLMYGSTAFIVRVCAGQSSHPKLWATQGVERGTPCLSAGMATSGALIDWLRQFLGAKDVQALLTGAESVPAGAEGVLVLPYFAGERSPLSDPDARGVVAGLTLRHSASHLARAVCEGIAYGIRHSLDTMNEVGGASDTLVAVGGGSGENTWTQIVSDVTGQEQLIPEVTIGASYGDALLAGIGTGLVAPDADWTVEKSRVRPNPDHTETYEELYQLFLQLYPETSDTVHRLATYQKRQGADEPMPRRSANEPNSTGHAPEADPPAQRISVGSV